MELQEAKDFLNENCDPKDNPLCKKGVTEEEIIREAENLMNAMERYYYCGDDYWEGEP